LAWRSGLPLRFKRYQDPSALAAEVRSGKVRRVPHPFALFAKWVSSHSTPLDWKAEWRSSRVDGAWSRTPGSRANRVESPPSRTERGKGGATPFWESLKEWASPHRTSIRLESAWHGSRRKPLPPARVHSRAHRRFESECPQIRVRRRSQQLQLRNWQTTVFPVEAQTLR